MAYTGWSVVFGEQPSAAKWNILGTNDASFNDGTGIADGAVASTKLAEAFLRGRFQANTTDTAPTGLTFQHGWGFMEGNSTAVLTEAVTFPAAFSTAPFVIASSLGADTSTIPDTIDDFVNVVSGATVAPQVTSITTSNCNISLVRSASTFATSNWFGYSWIAIGTV